MIISKEHIAKTFLQWIVRFMPKSKNERPAFSMIRVENKGKALVATDGQRLAIAEFSVDTGIPNGNYHIAKYGSGYLLAEAKEESFPKNYKGVIPTDKPQKEFNITTHTGQASHLNALILRDLFKLSTFLNIDYLKDFTMPRCIESYWGVEWTRPEKAIVFKGEHKGVKLTIVQMPLRLTVE